MYKSIRTLPDEIQQIFQQLVLVLISHAINRVVDVASIMFDHKLPLSWLEVRVRGESVKSLNKGLVCCARIGVCGRASIIQSCENPWRSFLFYQLTHNLIVEIIDGRPLNLFPCILFLLRLQSQLNEDLLKLLIDIIDT